MPLTRVKPCDVKTDLRRKPKLAKTSAKFQRELKRRRQSEVRVHVYNDQYKIIDQWTKTNETSVANLVRTLLNYFIYMSEKRRKHLFRNY